VRRGKGYDQAEPGPGPVPGVEPPLREYRPRTHEARGRHGPGEPVVAKGKGQGKSRLEREGEVEHQGDLVEKGPMGTEEHPRRPEVVDVAVLVHHGHQEREEHRYGGQGDDGPAHPAHGEGGPCGVRNPRTRPDKVTGRGCHEQE